MKSRNRTKSLLLILAVALAMAIPGPAVAGQPPFSATIIITGDTTIYLGDTTTLTANWSTNAQDVTRYEWQVDGASQGVVSITGASVGSSTFDFTPTAVGDYEITFRIWHHQQTQRDASESVTVHVVTGTIEATVDIDPDTLNLDSEGVPVTCYIQLPAGYDVADIDVSSILLNDVISVALKNGSLWFDLQDSDADGANDTLMVKFDRQAVQDILDVGDEVEITVTGALTDGTLFVGGDVIRVIE